MSIDHHPPLRLLTDFAAGHLDQGQHLAVATHLAACRDCRALVHESEELGGKVLAQITPAALSENALAAALARLNAPAPRTTPRPPAVDDVPGLPDYARRYRFGPWRAIAPSLSMRPIALPTSGPTRAFLLKSRPNTRLLRHSHTGFEMTCVLTGGFEHDGGHFGPGDFDLGDASHIHEVTIADEGDCISLVAMQGGLRLRGLVGRLLQPFVRL